MRLSIRTKLITIFILLMAFMAVSMTVALVGLGRLDQRINQSGRSICRTGEGVHPRHGMAQR